MSTEYRVTWKRTAWKAGTWPRRKLFGSWASAVKQAKLLERDQPKYGPVEIEIHQRTCTKWEPTIWGKDLASFLGEDVEE